MRKLNDSKCILCGNDNWLPLPSPGDGQSLTTAGVVVNTPIGKAHCNTCGIVQKVYEEALAQQNFYETEYAGYYKRPATEAYHRKRYLKIVEWIDESIAPCRPESILDVGCGQGGAMRVLRNVYPKAKVVGLEPSRHNAHIAEKIGFEVYKKKLGENVCLNQKFDVAIAIYVLQHVLDPVDFLKGLKRNLKPGGVAAIVVPNGNRPNIELLWSDQNFAFTAKHLMDLSRLCGFRLLGLYSSPEEISTSWMAVLENDDSEGHVPRQKIELPEENIASVYDARVRYLNSFQAIDHYLCEQLEGKVRVINFGASFWTSILAVYCPRYWSLVDFCAVDGAEGTIYGKKVIAFERIVLSPEDGLTLGVAKDAQERLCHRFLGKGIQPVTWHQLVSW